MAKSITKDVRNAFNNLSAQEQKVVLYRLRSKTLRETAKKFGLKTSSRAHYVEKCAWAKVIEQVAHA